ncbi:uncharacterized protein METZ01_LOCUS150479, partial [marine metagenome]
VTTTAESKKLWAEMQLLLKQLHLEESHNCG